MYFLIHLLSRNFIMAVKNYLIFLEKFSLVSVNQFLFFALAIIHGLVCLLPPFFGFFYSQT